MSGTSPTGRPSPRAHGARFGAIQPANTLVGAALVGDEYLVEIEAEAEVGSDGLIGSAVDHVQRRNRGTRREMEFSACSAGSAFNVVTFTLFRCATRHR